MDKDDFKKYLGKEHSYIISNHSYEIDWILLLSLAEKAKCGGNSKTFIKNVVQYTPGFGMVLYLADYVCLARSFEKDKLTIDKKMREIVNYPDPVWLVLYPEGTRFTQKKHEASMHFAKENGLPELAYHLSPRTKGFATSLPPIEGKMKGLYDVTIAFNAADEVQPKIQNLFFGRKVKVHYYIQRIPFEDVPKDEKAAGDFIQNLFVQKDKLRDSFYKTGDFFAESGVKRVDKITLKKNYKVLLNAVFWYTFSVGILLKYLINLFFSECYTTLGVWIVVIMTFAFIMHKAMGMSQLNQGSNIGPSKNIIK